MATGRYRSIFHSELPADEAFAAAEQQLRGWLGLKNLDQNAFDRGSARVGQAGEVLLALARNSADGTQTKRWQLREPKDDGSWVTTLTVHAPGRLREGIRSWFWLDVEFLPSPGIGPDDQDRATPPRAAVPRLARLLLDSIDARDSLAQLQEKPILVRPPDIDGLIDILCDPDRRMPVIVASAHPGHGFQDWRETIDRTTRFAAGLASLYLLDPLASDLFNKEIGGSHQVWGGAVRTYLPGVDPASAEDALRHRVLSPVRIQESVGRATGLLSGLPRRLSDEALMPRPLAGLSRALLSGEPPKEGPGPSSSAGEESGASREEVDRLQDNLDTALELVVEAERTEELLAERNDLLSILTAEFDAANQRAETLEDQVRTLRRRLIRAGSEAEANAPAEERTILPTSLAEVLDGIEDLKRVDFTGNIDAPLNMDSMPTASSWAQTAWQAVLAMNDYAETSAAGDFAGSFATWCKRPPPGARAISAGKVAADESDTVKNDPKMSRKRWLPVPAEVDPSEKVFMWAHVRLGGGAGMSAPRLHYVDDVKNTGKIYIGYLGPHLQIKSTN